MKGTKPPTNFGPHALAVGETTSEAQLQNVMYMASSTAETELAGFADALKSKAQTTKGLSTRQMAAYDRQMLTAVKDAKPRHLTDASKLAVAAVVPGALGVLQPTGSEMADSASETSQMTALELQDAMQKQHQIMQMMSNISKSMHETQKAIINNIKA